MSDWIIDSHSNSSGYGNLWGAGRSNLGPEYQLSDSGQLQLASEARTHATTTATTATTTTTTGASPASTLVGSSSGLQIDLIWDSSVQASSNWQSFEQAVEQAAQIYTTQFSTHALINIHIGLGEVNGQALGSGALGESESNGYLVSYGQVTNALANADAGLVSSGQMAAGAVTADTALSGKTFFLPTAEAKALGLASATGAGVDGYVGLINSSALFFPASGGQIAANQYDAVGVAAHEISEVMGRIGMLGSQSGYYTPLDLFRYTAAHQPDTTPTAGYFSTDLGATVLNSYNNPANGGDAADWASTSANARDAYNAFDNPGVITNLNKNDLLEVAALGYKPAGALTAVTA